jgi:hypothetical protein
MDVRPQDTPAGGQQTSTEFELKRPAKGSLGLNI